MAIVQPVSDIARLFATPFVDPKTGLITQSWREYMRYNVHAKVFGSLDIKGNIVKTTPIAGKPDGISQTTSAVAFGKNLLPNPGFEFNTYGALLNTDTKTGVPVCDAWAAGTTDPHFTVWVDNAGFGRTGHNCLRIKLKDNVTVPNGPLVFSSCQSIGRLPCSETDIARISGFVQWGRATPFPAGVTGGILLDVLFFDSAGNFVSTIQNFFTDSTIPVFNAYTLLQAAIIVPSGLNISYCQILCQSQVTNSSGSNFNTGTGNYADILFDDLKFVLQNTAFDLTPINTAGTPATTAGLCTQAGTTGTINITSSTWQFGDGQIHYNAGSVNTGQSSGTLTWYIYADDPTFAGGAVTYQATTTPSVCNAVNGRLVFGNIQITVGGGGGGAISTGGGSGGGGPRGKAFLL